MIRLPLLLPTSVLCFVASFPVHAAGGAADWLVRMHQAAQRLNYEGTFVYQRGSQLETMRIFHRVDKGVVKERLISLTGPAREVIRTDQEVRCYLPDQKSIVIEHRRYNRSGFVDIIPARLADLDQNYRIELGGTARVAGRAAQQLQIRPRDDFRYGHRLWADRETGLLLKADLVDEQDNTLEQFFFTQVVIGGSIPDAAFMPQTPDQGMVWYRDSEVPAASQPRTLRATQLPKGFRLASAIVRRLPKEDRIVEQLVYSDSLAAVSIFVERLSNGSVARMDGHTQMGALHALGKRLEGFHVTVVGEVPAKTITAFGNSLAPASAPAR